MDQKGFQTVALPVLPSTILQQGLQIQRRDLVLRLSLPAAILVLLFQGFRVAQSCQRLPLLLRSPLPLRRSPLHPNCFAQVNLNLRFRVQFLLWGLMEQRLTTVVGIRVLLGGVILQFAECLDVAVQLPLSEFGEPLILHCYLRGFGQAQQLIV